MSAGKLFGMWGGFRSFFAYSMYKKLLVYSWFLPVKSLLYRRE